MYKKLFSILLTCLILTNNASAVSEIPVLVKPPSLAKIFALIDDSGSMLAGLEHPNFSSTSACSTNSANTIPSIFFSLQSGGSGPSTAQQLLPVLIEYNPGFGSSSSNSATSMYQARTFNNPSSFPIVTYNTCNNSSGNTVCCSGSGGGCTSSGINALQLFGNASYTGANVFQIARLAQSGGSYVTDSSGNEQLYVSYRKNDYERSGSGDDWTGVWAKFDSSNNQIPYYTAAFVTEGGTVVFNGKEVFLSEGWYRLEYLRWLFYCATNAELAALPGINRLEAVKEVMTDIINDNPSVQFGLGTLNGSSFTAGTHSGNLSNQWYTPQGNSNTCTNGIIRNAIGTSTATLLTSLASLSARGGTGLATAYIEVLRYFGGATDTDTCTGSTSAYTSPITGQCDAHSIIVLTDGLPSGEVSRRLPNGQYPTNLDGVSNPASNMNNCSDSDCRATFLSDASWYAYHTDMRTTVPGTQNIPSYSIAFGVSAYPLLNRFALAGGSGTSYTSTTADDLSNTLQDIVSIIFDTPTSGAGVATLEKLFGETKVYQPVFYADKWVGRIQVYSYDESNDELDYEYDMADLLEERNISSNPRNILVGYDSDYDGLTNQTRSLTLANAPILRPELFRFFISGAENSALLAAPVSAYNTNVAAENLIRYIQGEAVSGLRERDRDADGYPDRLGDTVYSKPIEVGPKNGNYNTLNGYNSFVASRQSQPRILLVGANDGMLHAFDSTTGEELWAYIPSSQLPYLERLSRAAYDTQYRRSYIDGPITVEDVYRNGAWSTLAMVGLRTGGSTYFVLDITNRANPTLVWEVSHPSVYGQSWTKPAVIIAHAGSTATSPSAFNWYMAVGTGEGKTSAGTNLAVYNLGSATPPAPVTIAISAADAAGTRTSGIATVQGDVDRNVDRLYVGTELGDLYRVHVMGASPASWVVQRLFDGASTQPIVATPLVVLAQNPQYTSGGMGVASEPLAASVFFGTGRYDTSSDIATVGGIAQSIYAIYDPMNTSNDSFSNVLTNRTRAHLQNQSVGSYNVRRDISSGKYFIPAGRSGLYIDLSTSLTVTGDNFINPAGMVVNPMINIRGIVLATTFLPEQNVAGPSSCDIGGYGFLQGLHMQTGGGAIIDMYTDPERSFYNGGIPDITGDLNYTSTDLTSGISQGVLEPILDTQVSSIDLSDDVTPYEHDGELNSADVRLQSSGGGITPAVSSIGHTGLPSSPTILLGAQKVLTQDAYPSNPNSNSSTSPSSEEDSGDVGTTGQMPPPKLAPISIYTLPLEVLSFHESTGQ